MPVIEGTSSVGAGTHLTFLSMAASSFLKKYYLFALGEQIFCIFAP